MPNLSPNIMKPPAGSEHPSRGYPGRINFLVTADSFLPHSGGSRVYYSNLYRNILAQYPDKITVLTKKVPGWQEFDLRESSESFRIRRRFRPLPNWKYWQLPSAFCQLLEAAAAVTAGSYDCLHCGDLFPQGLTGILLRKVFKLPLVIFCHGDEISQTDKRRYQPRVRDFIYQGADAVIAANQFAFDELVQIGVHKDRIHKLTPGVDVQHFQPRPRNVDLIERYRLKDKKVLLTVARLVPRKNQKLILQALPKVLTEVPNLRYLIAGDGPDKRNLQNLVRELQLNDVVTFVGDVAHHQLCDYYNLCDVFAMVNRLEAGGDVETFGMVFTEANAVGKPVIGGKTGGTAEAVVDGETGFLVDPNSVDELSNRLLLLLRNENLCKNMGAAGLERVLAEFDWSIRARLLREISAEVIAKVQRGAPARGLDIKTRDSKAV
jgi:phosphatidylinositol alpha-1,6-mannosyltransferase